MAEEKWVPNKFESDEEICIKAFIKFTQFKSLKKYFRITGATEYGTMCDVVGENKTGGTVVVELKHREDKSTGFTDCFIEVGKYNNLMKLYDKGCLPMYLNIIGDCYWLWILPSVPENTMKLYKNVPIKSSISGKKIVDRYGLQWQHAWVFDSKGNIIQESSCKHNIPNPPIHHDIDFNKITNDVLNKL